MKAKLTIGTNYEVVFSIPKTTSGKATREEVKSFLSNSPSLDPEEKEAIGETCANLIALYIFSQTDVSEEEAVRQSKELPFTLEFIED